MAVRNIAVTDSLETFRTEFNNLTVMTLVIWQIFQVLFQQLI